MCRNEVKRGQASDVSAYFLFASHGSRLNVAARNIDQCQATLTFASVDRLSQLKQFFER